MTSEGSGGSKFAQLVTNHVLGDIHGNVLAAVMNGDRMADEGGENGGCSGPGLEHLFLIGLVEFLNALIQLRSYERAFFTLLLIVFPPYLLFLRLTMNLSVGFFVLRVL